MFDRVTLTRDLVDARGGVLGRRGLVVSVSSVLERARCGGAARPTCVPDAQLAADLCRPLADPCYQHVFRDPTIQGAVVRALNAIRLPAALLDEFRALHTSDPARYRHALTTAAVAARLFVAVVGDAPALAAMATAGLLHDIGMRHVDPGLARNDDGLEAREVMDVASHPLLGGWHLAVVLGEHPAVDAALGHHWRSGHGYPSLTRPPSRSVEVVAVASAFAALTQERAFRSAPFDARGAVDVLVAEAKRGRADGTTVRLLVHALRNGRGELRAVRFGRERIGHAPAVNRHTRIEAQGAAPG
jgi:HD-GYP domain-containing protein (c-di-GMP phosphodiesterase class II)